MAAARSAIVIGKNDMSSLEPVKPASPRVIMFGQFVVLEAHQGKLHFVAVVGGFRWRAEEGNYYALIIENQDRGGATYLHKALVCEIPGKELKLIRHWE